jgi:hypothetical protein
MRNIRVNSHVLFRKVSLANMAANRTVRVLTVFMSIPSCRLIIILDTPVSKYFHLQISKQGDDLAVAPTDGREHKITHVASKSSRFGTGGIGATRVVLVEVDILADVVRIASRWRYGGVEDGAVG